MERVLLERLTVIQTCLWG